MYPTHQELGSSPPPSSSPLRWKGRKKGLAGLSWRRNQPKLFLNAQAIKVAFDPLQLASSDFNEFTSWLDHTAASGGETMKRAGVGATHDPTPDCQVCGDCMQRHRLRSRIGEASKEFAKEVFDGLY